MEEGMNQLMHILIAQIFSIVLVKLTYIYFPEVYEEATGMKYIKNNVSRISEWILRMFL
jgi:hypothetical protein